MKRLTSFILFLPLFFACISEDAIHPSIKSERERAFLIEEAQRSFETFYSENVGKLSQNFSINKLSPGDFTPLWSENRYYESEKYATYEISIDPERRISALYATIQKGKAVAKKSPVVQKLIVSKNTDSGIISFFIVNMIPSDKCSESSVYLSSLSGLVIYTRIADNAIFRVDKFSNGKISDKGDIDTESYYESRQNALSILGSIKFKNTRRITTKFGEYDDWGYDDYYDEDWDYGDSDGYNDLGNGLFEDESGDLYYDTDGDGYPDSMVIDGSVVTDGDDSGWDDGAGWNDDWPIDYPDDNNHDNEHDYGLGLGSGDFSSDSDPDGNDKLPSRLEEFIGTPEYYKERVTDFINRYGDQITPPTYYTTYGETYCERFNYETKEKLSEAGQKWVDDTTVKLQELLNEILLENPGIELNHDLLEELAFDVHVEAYEECGIYELPIDDKIDILLTVDLDDLMKENGIEQVGEIIEGQIGYYIDHPNALLEDTWYIIDHWDDIWDTLSEYIDKQKQNETKSGPIYDEYDIYNLILAPLIEYYEANVPGFEAPELP